jgi:hypothetical protein
LGTSPTPNVEIEGKVSTITKESLNFLVRLADITKYS